MAVSAPHRVRRSQKHSASRLGPKRAILDVMSNAYEKPVSALAEPERLPARIFQPDSGFSVELCDFILALAVAFNDLRDVLLAWILLADAFPESAAPSARGGQAGGVAAHLFRNLSGIMHALLVSVDRSTVARQDGKFATIVKNIHPDARHAWYELVQLERGSKSSDPLARYVYWARNQVAFHYDPQAIRRGFELAFRDPTANQPWISGGRTMASSRFYFADAAVDAYMREWAADVPSGHELLTGKSEVVSQINHAVRVSLWSSFAFAVLTIEVHQPHHSWGAT